MLRFTKTPFHQSRSWKKLAAEFKTPRCIDCGSKVDLQAGHVLPASRFKMMRLWKSNLVNQCAVCNLKLGANIRWSIQAVKLLSIIMIIKLLKYSANGLIIIILSSYIYIDMAFNASTITNHIKSNFVSAYQWIDAIEFNNQIKDLP